MAKKDTFATNLKKLRKSAGLSQDNLAKLTGITKTTISRFERGVQAARSNNLHAIARVLNCNLDDLFAGEDGKTDHLPKSLIGPPPPVITEDESRLLGLFRRADNHLKALLIHMLTELVRTQECKFGTSNRVKRKNHQR